MLWTAPLATLATVVAGAPAPTLDHRGLALVYLVVDEDRYSEVDAYYVPDAAGRVRPVVRAEELPLRTRPGRSHRALRRGAGNRRRRDVDGRRRQLGDLVVDGMRRLGLRVPSTSGVVVRRLPRVYPLLPVGHDGRDAALAWSDTLPGVVVLGRQGAARRRQPAPRPGHGPGRGGCLGDDGWDTGLGRRTAASRPSWSTTDGPGCSAAASSGCWRRSPRSPASTPGPRTAPASRVTSRSTC